RGDLPATPGAGHARAVPARRACPQDELPPRHDHPQTRSRPMNDAIVPAHPDDAKEAARLIAETDADLFRFYTHGDLGLWVEVAEWEWRAERGIYSHTMSHVIRRAGHVAGLLVAYSSRRHDLIKWSLESSRARLRPDRLSRIDLVRSLASFLFPKLPEDDFSA